MHQAHEISDWVIELFARFTSIYQERFTKDLATREQQLAYMMEWSTEGAFKDITDEELEQCIAKAKRTRDWPPRISDFVEILKNVRRELKFQQESAAYMKALPATLEQQEKKREESRQIYLKHIGATKKALHKN